MPNSNTSEFLQSFKLKIFNREANTDTNQAETQCEILSVKQVIYDHRTNSDNFNAMALPIVLLLG